MCLPTVSSISSSTANGLSNPKLVRKTLLASQMHDSASDLPSRLLGRLRYVSKLITALKAETMKYHFRELTIQPGLSTRLLLEVRLAEGYLSAEKRPRTLLVVISDVDLNREFRDHIGRDWRAYWPRHGPRLTSRASRSIAAEAAARLRWG
jgi:hypothetical protein